MRRWLMLLSTLVLAPAALAREEESESTDATIPDLSVIQRWVETGKEWLVENGPSLIVKAVLFLAIYLAFKIIASFLGRVVEKALSGRHVKSSDLLKRFMVNVVTKTTVLAGLLLGLSVAGVPIGPLLAGVGVLGFVVGFALQDTLSQFAAGIMILMYRPYDVGDVVSAGGVTGKVSSMNLVSTTFLTPDNQVQVVPNGSIWGGVITNITANDTRRVDLVVGVGYESDIPRTEAVLSDVVAAHEMVLSDPAPAVKVHNLGESSVDFVVRPWCRTSDYWDVYWDLTRAFKLRLDQEGISIPFPQRDIHIVSGEVAQSA